jgi:hypothetical protein
MSFIPSVIRSIIINKPTDVFFITIYVDVLAVLRSQVYMYSNMRKAA